MDAYSYISRGQVFSNGQTGNLLLFGVNLASGNFYVSFHYIVPVIAFASGIALSEVIHIVAYKRNKKFLSDTSKDSDNVCNKSVETSGRRPSRLMPSFSMLSFHWRQVSILIEAVIIILVAFVPVGENQLANSLTSLACGIQVESFRRIHNRNIATAMCVGNMRTAVESLCSYYYHREPSVKKTFLIYSSAMHQSVFRESNVGLWHAVADRLPYYVHRFRESRVNKKVQLCCACPFSITGIFQLYSVELPCIHLI